MCINYANDKIKNTNCIGTQKIHSETYGLSHVTYTK